MTPADINSALSAAPAWRQLVESRSIPKPLWHYTSAEGLVGILRSGQIHATDIFHLNDSAEVKHAFDVARKFLTEVASKLAKISKPSIADQFICKYSEVLDSNSDVLAYLKPFGVSCFCHEGNVLGNWRSYGAACSGYSIGFDYWALRQLIAKAPGALLVPVIYDINQQWELLREMFAIAYNIIDRSNLTGTQVGEVGQMVLGRFLAYSMIFKGPGFSEEREWRIVYPALPLTDTATLPRSGANCDFRARNGTIIPYYPIPIRKADGSLPITHIMMGPNIEEQLGRRAVQFLLQMFNGEIQVPVSASGLTART